MTCTQLSCNSLLNDLSVICVSVIDLNDLNDSIASFVVKQDDHKVFKGFKFMFV